MIRCDTKILLIGSSGQVGSALLEILENKNNIISPENICFLNLASEDLEQKLSILNPNIIINTWLIHQ